VLFKFPSPLSAVEEQEMLDQIGCWPDSIPGFTGLRFGKDVGGRSSGYDYLLLTEFESEDAHQSYYSQPSHVAFGEWVATRGAEVIRVDYELNENSLLL
jgi:heme-degrading monooxygenase HmoA